MTKARYFRLFYEVAVIAALAFAMVSALWFNYIAPPIEGHGETQAEVKPGEYIWVDWEITKRVKETGNVTRTWFGADGFYEPRFVGSPSLPLGHGVYSIGVVVPENAPAGPLKLFIEGWYQDGGRKRDFSLGPVTMEVVP